MQAFVKYLVEQYYQTSFEKVLCDFSVSLQYERTHSYEISCSCVLCLKEHCVIFVTCSTNRCE